MKHPIIETKISSKDGDFFWKNPINAKKGVSPYILKEWI